MGLAWGAALLPFVEQQALYNEFNTRVPIWSVENLAPRERHLKVHLCPSDTYSSSTFVVRDDSATPIEQYASSSYAANWGPSSATVNLDDTPLLSRGVFYRNSKTKFRDITDGLSNTLAIGERINGPIPSSQPTAGGHSVFENAWSAAVREITDLGDDHGHMVLFETQFRPNEIDGDDKGVSAPHTGLALFGFCDGSVHILNENIDETVYNNLATRNGGEIIGEY
jgi:hypothetical protein